jgi:aprataxin and PNK-like factor
MRDANNGTIELRVRNIGEINDGMQDNSIAISYSQVTNISSTDNNVQTSNQATVSSSSRKRSSTPDDETDSAKKPKPTTATSITSEEQVPSSSSSTAATSTNNNNNALQAKDSDTVIYFKPDPDSTNEQAASSSAANVKVKQELCDKSSVHQPSSSNVNPNENVEVKKEPEDANKKPSAGRPSCDHGIRCFITENNHGTNFAHPRDADYRRPEFPPAANNLPRCPYWESCYRRNPQHFREMQHPASNVYTPATPPQQQQQQARGRARGNVLVVGVFDNDNDDNDEYDEYDDDIDSDNESYFDDTDVDEDYEIDISQSQDAEDDEFNLEE